MFELLVQTHRCSGSYLVDYNVKKQPDVLLVQAMDKIFAFQMSHEYVAICYNWQCLLRV